MDTQDRSTIIGFFSDAWDAQRALENLKAVGCEHIRYIQNDTQHASDSTKDKGGFTGFLARIYGFDDDNEYLDARGNWSVNPDAEAYFSHAYQHKHHVLLVQAAGAEEERVHEILRQHNGKVEQQNFAFFTNAGKAELINPTLEGHPNPYPPLQAIEREFERDQRI